MREQKKLRSCALISYLVPDEMLDQLTQIDPEPAIQTQRFGLVLLDLLKASVDRLGSYNFIPIQDYPIGRKIWFGGGSHFIETQRIISLPFINLIVLKHLSRLFSLALRFPELRQFDAVIVHGLHLPNLVMARLLKCAKVRIGVVLTDQQGLFLPTDGILRRMLKRLDRDISVKLTRGFDFGIALSPGLAQTYLPDRPVKLLPGVYNQKLEQRFAARQAPKPSDRFRVLYFGGLTTEYGLEALLGALPLLDNNIEIAIFGKGIMRDTLAAAAEVHPNLIWGGLVNQDRLLDEMKKCDLLINARAAGSEMARLSSPSKLIEYAASGKPVMTTRLLSLPPELLDSLLLLDNETPEGIAAAINSAAKTDRKLLERRGQDFQIAVRSNFSIGALQTSIDNLLGYSNPPAHGAREG